jgi:hypothetical protein
MGALILTIYLLSALAGVAGIGSAAFANPGGR